MDDARRSPVVWLLCLTVGYLLLPSLLYTASWLATPAAFLFTALLTVGFALTCVDYVRQSATPDPTAPEPSGLFRPSALLSILLVSILAVAISGIGGYGHQGYDWSKHDLVLRDLVQEAWPVRYGYLGQPVALVYYIAYYLPAALVGKAAGWLPANDALAVWSTLGLFLTLLWFVLLVGHRSVAAALVIFAIFSGLDVLGSLLTHPPAAAFWPQASFPAAWSPDLNFDGWAGTWQYPSHVKLWLSVPNQALAGWLSAAVVLYTILHLRSPRSLIYVWALTALWSPFVTIGLLPFMACDFLLRPGPTLVRIRRYLSVQNLSGALLLALLALFYATKAVPVASVLDEPLHSTFLFSGLSGWSAQVRLLLLLIAFCLLEFGMLVLLIQWSGAVSNRKERLLLVAAVAWLVLLTLWIFGDNNDLGMRAPIPAFFYLAVLAAVGVLKSYRSRPRLTAWVLFLVIAAANPISDIAGHLAEIAHAGQLRSFKLNPEDDENLVEAFQERRSRLKQYISDMRAPYFAWFARGSVAGAESRRVESILFDDVLVLMDASLDAHEAEPGGRVVLSTVFQVLETPEGNYAYATRLLGQDGEVIWFQEDWPSGRPTDQWRPFRPYYDSRTVRLPDATAPGVYLLEAYVTDPGTRDKTAAVGLSDGEAFGLQAPLDYVVVGGPDDTPHHAAPERVVFDPQMQLVGSNLPASTQAAPGDLLDVSITWRALAALDEDLTATVQVLDSQGRLAAQQDHPPLNGLIPLDLWRPGFTAADHYQVQLPAALAPGRYRLIVALYDQDGRRRPVQVGEAVAQDAYTLAAIEVTP